MPNSPILDTRTIDAILEQLRAMAPFYTPEWNANRESGPSAALLQIHAKAIERLITRLNQTPDLNFIAFLNMLGAQLLPAQPSRAPLMFSLATGSQESALVPARSPAAGAGPDGKQLIFETEQDLLATPAKLQAVLSTVPALDQLYDHFSPLSATQRSELFREAAGSVQTHILYIGHADLFNVKDSVVITLTGITVPAAANLIWEYSQGDGKPWLPFNSTTTTAAAITLTKTTTKTEIKTTAVNATKNRWIRARATSIAAAEATTVQNPGIRISPPTTTPAAADQAFYNDIEIDLAAPIYPFSRKPRLFDGFYLASQECFSKKDAQVTVNFQLSEIGLALGAYAFSHAANTTVAVRQPTAVFLTNLAAQATAGSNTLLFPAAGSLPAANTVLQINAGTNLEYAIVQSSDTTTRIVTLVAPLLRTHNTGTGLRSVTFTNVASTTLATSVNPLDATLPVTQPQLILDELIAGNTIVADIDTGANRELHTVAIRRPAGTAQLAWEYWNGTGWVALSGVTDSTSALIRNGAISFTCPTDIAPVAVIGQENHWIRARLISGDYGSEVFSINSSNQVTVTDQFTPPVLQSLTITYSINPTPPQSILSENALQFLQHTTALTKPFRPLDDSNKTLYFGFDRAPLKGPIGIFISLLPQIYLESQHPRIEWEYYRTNPATSTSEWSRLLVDDGTDHLTQSGVLQFIGPPDFLQLATFGKNLFWIRAIDAENRFQPEENPIARQAQLQRITLSLRRRFIDNLRLPNLRIPQADPCCTSPTPKACIEQQSFLPEFRPPSSVPAPDPILNGIFVNAVWSTQSESIRGEILGSGTGAPNQSFTTQKTPAGNETVWVDEQSSLTEAERAALTTNTPEDVNEIKDETGATLQFQIRWQRFTDILDAGPKDRAYLLDPASGLITFGDGVNGAPPPVGRDNIRIDYSAGGGVNGNLDTGIIKTLRTTVPRISKVTNPVPAEGGADTEAVDSAMARLPQAIRNRGRAVTAEDYEWLAREASRSVGRAKCLPTFDDTGNFKTNWVTVIITPQTAEQRPTPSPSLRAQVKTYLNDRAPNLTTFPDHIQVTGPKYVKVSVTGGLIVTTLETAARSEAAALAALNAYLHPLTGGDTGTGWEFGRLPCISDFHALLESIEGVDHVEDLTLTLQAVDDDGLATGTPLTVIDDVPVSATMPPYALVFSGDHKLTPSVER